MNKIKINDFLIPIRDKKKFSIFIFLSICLILFFEVTLKNFDDISKIYVVNLDIKKENLESLSDSNDYFDKNRNVVAYLISSNLLYKNKNFIKLLREINILVQKINNKNIYAELNILKSRPDRMRIEIKSKNINSLNKLKKITKEKFNELIINLYLENLNASFQTQKLAKKENEQIIQYNRSKNTNAILRNIEFIEIILDKKMDLKKKNEIVQRSNSEYTKIAIENLEKKNNKWITGHKKLKEKIRLKKNFISEEDYEEFISISKNNIEIKYILQILSFIISYILVLFYSLKRKDNTNV